MKPSFLSSTLSIAFIICVVAVIVMIFMWVQPEATTFAVVTSVISAYLTNYGSKPQDKKTNEPVIENQNDTKPLLHDKSIDENIG